MSKDRQAITCNGRPAFYASMYEDIRQCAMDRGWAVALHGSLASDMDIMAMPWTEQAVPFRSLIDTISKLFDGNDLAENYSITYDEKACNRIVATIPIWADFYIDISTIGQIPKKPIAAQNDGFYCDGYYCPVCNERVDDDGRGYQQPYCYKCGQAIDWRGEE